MQRLLLCTYLRVLVLRTCCFPNDVYLHYLRARSIAHIFKLKINKCTPKIQTHDHRIVSQQCLHPLLLINVYFNSLASASSKEPWNIETDTEERNEKARRAYSALLTVTSPAPEKKEYLEFSDRVSSVYILILGKCCFSMHEFRFLEAHRIFFTKIAESSFCMLPQNKY